MKWLLIALPCVALIAVSRVLRRRWVQHHVSPAWLCDSERREWGAGIEQSCVQSWPVDKVMNELGTWNAR